MCPTFSACVRRSWAEDLRTTRSHLQARALPFLSRTLGLESRRAVAPRHLQPRCKAQLLAALLIRHRAPGRDHRRKPCSRLNESSVASQHTGLYELTAVLECLPGGLCAPGIRPKVITPQENALAAKPGVTRKPGHKARKLRWRLAGIPTELIYLV
jgi:hypothetical protein